MKPVISQCMQSSVNHSEEQIELISKEVDVCSARLFSNLGQNFWVGILLSKAYSVLTVHPRKWFASHQAYHRHAIWWDFMQCKEHYLTLCHHVEWWQDAHLRTGNGNLRTWQTPLSFMWLMCPTLTQGLYTNPVPSWHHTCPPPPLSPVS